MTKGEWINSLKLILSEKPESVWFYFEIVQEAWGTLNIVDDETGELVYFVYRISCGRDRYKLAWELEQIRKKKGGES